MADLNIDQLRELLAVLKEAGVTSFESGGVKIELGAGGKWTDFRAELARERDAEAEEEERVQFAHVAGGPPPRFSDSKQ